MGFIAAVAKSYANILNFSGRASRAEYWWFMFYQFLAIFAVTIGMTLYAKGLEPFAAEALAAQSLGVWTLVYTVAFWLPALSSIVRRLHDTDHSGWWYFIVMVPIVGVFVLMFFLLMPSSLDRNRFGTHPYGPKGKTPMRLPRGMKPAPSEAERRVEILEYYRKNIAQQGQPS
jgi:uncharacterized membrane protein YhaH (DUF805 family)